jgi:hypothetical protein
MYRSLVQLAKKLTTEKPDEVPDLNGDSVSKDERTQFIHWNVGEQVDLTALMQRAQGRPPEHFNLLVCTWVRQELTTVYLLLE